MYSIVTTYGFVIDSRPHGEAGRILSIFTRDLGLVFVTAQGIRLEKSKLRYYTQEYSFGRYSLVRGKEFWRLTSAQDVDSRIKMYVSPVSLAETTWAIKYVNHRQELIARIALLLKRLLHGEEAHAELFECVYSCAGFLYEQPHFTAERLETFESVVVLRILRLLGYIGDDPLLGEKMQSSNITVKLLDDLAMKRVLINQHINKALRESHL
jgi:DNA repair protein RecO